MAKPYDDGLKQLVRANPRAFVLWLFPQAQFVREHPYELKEWKLEVDTLIEVQVNGMPMLQHIEFQTRHDPTMAERLQRYTMLLWDEYNLPVLSWVIYLLKDEHAPSSPLKRRIPTGKKVHEFHFESLNLADLLIEDLRGLQQLELLPLLTLTSDGTRREVVKQMRGELLAAGRPELVQVGNTLASLAFQRKGDKADQEWLLRSMHEMQDILRETPYYQEILKEGHLEGIKEGELAGLRQGLVEVIVERFPKLTRLARKQVAVVDDPALLRHLLVKVSTVQSAEEAKQHLLAVDEDEDQ